MSVETKPRVLERDFSHSGNMEMLEWDHEGDGPSVTQTSVIQIHDTLTSAGEDIVGYHKLKKRGELLPLTRWTQNRIYWTNTFDYDLSYTSTSWRREVTGAQSNIDAPTLASAELKKYDASYFVQAAAAKIYSTGWDSLTFAAEFTKTVSMFRNFVYNLTRNVKQLRPEQVWLEGRYGWRVLFYDMKDIEQAIQNINDKRHRWRESIGTNLEESESNSKIQGFGAAGSVEWQFTDTYKIGLRGTVVADIEPPKLAFNPITTGWELITFSFVIDWVVNVGQFLESVSFLALSEKHYAASGHNVIINREVTGCTVTEDADWSISIRGFDISGYREVTWRTPTTVSINPLTRLRLNELKIVDLTALITQIARRKLEWQP